VKGEEKSLRNDFNEVEHDKDAKEVIRDTDSNKLRIGIIPK
jgi:hypothetical protein